MKILYYDCGCGISGDMNLAALVDLGVDFEFLKSELLKLNLQDEYEIECKKALKSGISATKVDVKVKKQIHERSFKTIKKIINLSSLNQNCKNKSLEIFTLIAKAEAAIHQKSIDDVHFHEIGATDSIIDIVGAAICYDKLKIDKIISSKIELGGGIIKCEHGILNVPAPAVCEILKDVPVSLGKADFEMTTPTGAGIIKTFASEFKKKIDFNIEKIGYGAGNKDADFANLLRVMICEQEQTTIQCLYQTVLETNIDDMDGESFSFIYEKLLENGALDVFSCSVFMKKNRIGFKLSVLCENEDSENLKDIIFKETSTIGIRQYQVLKTQLKRKSVEVPCKFGNIRVKVSYVDNGLCKVKPEFQDCKFAAIKNNVTLNEVKNEVLNCYDKITKFKK